MRKASITLAALVTVSVSADAADQTHEVKFKAGAISATINGELQGYNVINYLLGANAGQAMQVLFAPRNQSCYFNVYAPGASDATFIGSEVAGSNEYSANLTQSGKYRVQVYLMRNAARRNENCRYSITFEISG